MSILSDESRPLLDGVSVGGAGTRDTSNYPNLGVGEEEGAGELSAPRCHVGGGRDGRSLRGRRALAPRKR